MRVNSALLLGILLAAGAIRAESTPPKALLVLSKGDHTLAIVDPASLHVVARMPSGPDPHEVVASTDGRFAYISNYGGGAYNTITVIDLVEQKTLSAVDWARCADLTAWSSPVARSGLPRKPPKQSAATIRRRRRSIGCSVRARTGPT